MRPEYAPVARRFISVEGESTRVGQLTGFVVLGDGRMRSVDDVFEDFHPTRGFADHDDYSIRDAMCAVVLNVCEVTYFDWSSFAARFISHANEFEIPCILETRGGRQFDRLAPFGIYLHLTPGYTKIGPSDMKEGDEVKILVHQADDVPYAIESLKPFADAGIPSFILPRVRIEKAKHCFERFIEEAPKNVRMMLVEHEVIGIE